MKDFFLKIKNFIEQKPFWAVAVAAGLFFFLGTGSFAMYEKNKEKNFIQKNKPERQKDPTKYKFTSPLLDCNYADPSLLLTIDEMRDEIQKIINAEKNKSGASFSVYFRDLNNGPTMGIGEDEKFTPASLLKVPLMIAYLKKAETSPFILKEKIIYKKQAFEDGVQQNIKPERNLEDGKAYEVEDLIRRMIAYSDNSAANLLLEKIDEDFLANVYSDLGLEIPTSQKTENYMSVKEYASFFRILFNASYLNRDMSENALRFLSESKYYGGVKAGIPEKIQFSHKFGERVLDGVIQLHDCGIVYHSQTPYILCLMSKGNNFSVLERGISDISRKVYEIINNQ